MDMQFGELTKIPSMSKQKIYCKCAFYFNLFQFQIFFLSFFEQAKMEYIKLPYVIHLAQDVQKRTPNRNKV